MKVTTLPCLAFLGAVTASPTPQAAKAPYFYLVGDSTVAVSGGWGDGLLSYLNSPAQGENMAKSGTTTTSWRANGRWDSLMEGIEANKEEYEAIVTVQFGHNDQKSGDIDAFRENIVDFAREVEDAGATVILITSLTRRNFADNELDNTLHDWAGKTIAAAKEVGVQYLDLNKASAAYVSAIGEEDAAYYNLDGDDGTHLGPAGEAVFGRLTLDLLLEARGDLAKYFDENEALSEKIADGEFATGEE